jgi:uncharacterized protein YceK
MKKYFVLLIVSILIFSGCATIGERYTKPGRAIFNVRHSIIRQQEDLEAGMKSYSIIPSIRVNVSKSTDQQLETDLKWVLSSFGFQIVREGDIDYLIEVVKEDYASGYSSYHGYGSSSRRKSIMAVTLIIVDDTGAERSFRGMGEYSYRQYYSGYSYSSSMYQDPKRFAAKIAAAHAVAEMIIQEDISYRVPEK